eukprot:365233-Chlamydomonas_euryale.AAC.5
MVHADLGALFKALPASHRWRQHIAGCEVNWGRMSERGGSRADATGPAHWADRTGPSPSCTFRCPLLPYGKRSVTKDDSMNL